LAAAWESQWRWNVSESGAVGDIVWRPAEARISASNMARFAAGQRLEATEYEGLHAWSIRDPESYHRRLWDFLEIIGDMGSPTVIPGTSIRTTRFFPGARLNYAENLLAQPDDRMALICHRDDGTRRTLTRRHLHDLVSRIVQALRGEGVGPGDRIAAIVTNDVESIALYLASAAIGAIWASCSPDFGPAGASDRLDQIDAKILVAVPGYAYAGKWIDTTATINAIAECRSIEKIVLLQRQKSATDYVKPHVFIDDWLAALGPGPISYCRQEFNAPLAILFSSGTTGKPKCIVHGAGGLLLQHKKEQVLHCDLKPGERLFYYTTCGWMMWNWLISGLASFATLVTFDGSPTYPAPQRLIDLIDAESIAVFGTSAKYIDSCQKGDLRPRLTHSLASLKTILSTGSPLLPQSFDYIYSEWKADLHLASISGGTDICGCFLGGVPTLPVRRGELQAAMLGMDVAALSHDGAEIVGTPGELVCRNAHVSMPVGFWQDDGSRYRASYFTRFPGVWAHGDYVEKRPSGGFIVHGRSDTTLNPSGVRIGTAEIYRQVEAMYEVLEAVCVGQDWKGDQRVVLFVRLRPGLEMTEELQKTIRARIRSGATPRHVPARIVSVPDIPRTRSGKISEVAVRETIHGRVLPNHAVLANPECLDHYRNLAALAE
jgi:acetoacetyl-CoA synthetase